MTTAKPKPRTRTKVTATPTATPTKAPRKARPNAIAKAAAAPAATPDSGAAKPKHKLVRDSYTIPKSEYLVLESLKLRAAKLARPTKKSEVLRAGISALHAMNDKAFLAALGTVPSIKTGRPKNAPPAKADAT